jgi:hypothetical protein
MIETEGSDDERKKCPQSENYPWSKFALDLGTLLVLLATMLGVFWYASEAQQANTLTQTAIDTQSRPYLRIQIDPDGFKTDYIVSVPFLVINEGKLPARTIIGRGSLYAKSDSDVNGRILSNLVSSQENKFIFNGDPQQFSAPSSEPLSPGTLVDLKSGQGAIYVAIALSYGTYHTTVCEMFGLKPTADPAGLPKLYFRSMCGGEDLNSAN